MANGAGTVSDFNFADDPDVSRREKAKEIFGELKKLGCLFDEYSVPFCLFCPDDKKLDDVKKIMEQFIYERIDSFGKTEEYSINDDKNRARRDFANTIISKLSKEGYRFDIAFSPLVVKYPKYGAPGAAKALLKDYPYPYAEPIPVDYKLPAPGIGGAVASTTPRDAPAALLPDPK